jgi:excisionase family DNA binding protein
LKWLTPRQAAELLQLPIRTVTDLCARDQLAGARKFGRHWRIPASSLGAHAGLSEEVEGQGGKESLADPCVCSRPSAREVFDGTKKEAEAAEARWRLELEAASPADSRIAPPFLRFSLGRYRIHAENHLKSGTWRNRKYQIATLVEFFGETPLTKITAAMVEQFQHLRLTQVGPVKVNDDVKVLKRILSYARSQGIPAAEPNVKRLPERTTKGRVLVWSADEVKSLYRAFQAESPALLPMTVCMLNTGLRKGEVLAMEWSAVDLDRGLLLIYPSADWQPKNGQPREVPIGSALRPWLEPPANPARWVFPSSKGQRYASWPQRQWDRARAASGVGGSPHVCRHTYASHFLASCPDLYLLAQILGHSDTPGTNAGPWGVTYDYCDPNGFADSEAVDRDEIRLRPFGAPSPRPNKSTTWISSRVVELRAVMPLRGLASLGESSSPRANAKNPPLVGRVFLA